MQSFDGILNFSAKCEDFFKEYLLVQKNKIYSFESIDCSKSHGLLLYAKEGEAINIPVGNSGYYNLNQITTGKNKLNNNVYNLLLVTFELYGIKIPLGFVKERHGDFFESYILTQKDNEFNLLKMKVSDIFCLTNFLPFPVYVNKKLYEDFRFSTEEVIIEP